MGYVEVSSVIPLPDDVDGMFIDVDPPGAVTVIIRGRVHIWPWQQAAVLATELAVMAGRAACRTDATWQDISDALTERRP